MTNQLEGQMHLSDLDTWSGKTYQERSAATKEKTFKPFSRKSSGSQNRNAPMCLCLTGGGGKSQDASMMKWEDGALLGEYMMHSFGEQPKRLMDECIVSEPHNGESVSHLSQILMETAQPKYYLSARACIGILNRAAKRGKELPEILKKALTDQINRDNSNS